MATEAEMKACDMSALTQVAVQLYAANLMGLYSHHGVELHLTDNNEKEMIRECYQRAEKLLLARFRHRRHEDGD